MSDEKKYQKENRLTVQLLFLYFWFLNIFCIIIFLTAKCYVFSKHWTNVSVA